MFQAITIAHLFPDKVADVIAAAKELAKETRVQKGNVYYTVSQPGDRDDVLVITECWETFEDFQGHGDPNGPGAEALGKFVSVVEPASSAPSEFYFGNKIV